ncbi:DUF1934 domain-containing protein [Oceanobacillus alkalisoli]|uniref:DUF1934 domain-containing protein n=1 Tax=Oceanobacillus alkalisoli TaxID=2925113 RepID=UPI001EF01F36|nr:DUF1934 domain-containing protein [Oceanobacillus alkalisoli]MCF3942770.1 DUF1934 domain-containing protein [Oceanobacillus alkalisoli]MCG5102741.1 DUF1934 domain-containing protein [Oceanobacillus alkalisoli]
MNEPEKRVAIQLKMKIQDASDKEVNHIKSTGVFFRKGKLDVLRFEEKIDDVEISTLVTIQKGKVTIKRSGGISMHQQFRLGQITENVYKHPHGNLHMETFTQLMMYQPLGHGIPARLNLDYTVKLNGQDERKHTLELMMIEEDPE